MTQSDDKILGYFAANGYDFFDDIEYEETESIYDDDDINRLIDQANSFSGIDNSTLEEGSKEAFKEVWQKNIVPRWEIIARDNSNRLVNELKDIARQDIINARTPEERFEAEDTLRNINPQSLGQLKTSEKRRATKAFRILFQ